MAGVRGTPSGWPAGKAGGLGRRISLDPAARGRFAVATRLHPDEVAALCVADLADRYAPLNPRFLGRTRQPDSVAAGNWIFGRSARYCPDCLAGDGSTIQNLHGGAWQRRWHLPIVFACITHQQLLARRCPACDLPVHHAANQPVPCPTVPDPHPVQCRNPITNRPRRNRSGNPPRAEAWAALPVPHQLD